MLFERLSQKVLKSEAGDCDRVFYLTKVRIKLLELGIRTSCFKEWVKKKLSEISGMIPWDQKPRQG